MSATPENREELQTKAPTLRDVVLKTAFNYRRSLSPDVQMIELDSLAERAAEMRQICQDLSELVSSMVIIDHKTGRLLMRKPQTQDDLVRDPGVEVRIDLMKMTAPRRIRQDKSVGLIILAVGEEQSAIPAIATLLIEERDPQSPAAVMINSRNGNHIFFRTSRTIEQSKEENLMLTSFEETRTTIGDFAKSFNLAHFYCPQKSTIATPVLF